MHNGVDPTVPDVPDDPCNGESDKGTPNLGTEQNDEFPTINFLVLEWSE